MQQCLQGWISKHEPKSSQLKYAGTSEKNKIQQTQTNTVSTYYFPNGSTKYVNGTPIKNLVKSVTAKVLSKGVNSNIKPDVKDIITLD